MVQKMAITSLIPVFKGLNNCKKTKHTLLFICIKQSLSYGYLMYTTKDIYFSLISLGTFKVEVNYHAAMVVSLIPGCLHSEGYP